MMATNHTLLLHAQITAKDLYDIAKNATSTKANPPEGQNINKRILKMLIDEADDDWGRYVVASMTFINQGTHAEEERERILNQLSLEYAPHRDWLVPVKQIYENLELADDPPVQKGLKCKTEVDKM